MHTQRHGGLGLRAARSLWALILVGIAILSAPLLGHHSFAAYYFEDDTIEVEGEIMEFQYRSPHAWVHIMGQDPFGKPQAYAAEWSNPTRLERDGIKKNTLRAGDIVRIWGAPSRNANDNRIHLKRIERRSDGWKWEQARRERR
jgi:hypothetical protein